MRNEKGSQLPPLPVCSVLGLPYCTLSEKSIVQHLLSAALARRPAAVFTPGATVAAKSARSEDLRRVLLSADMLLADGYGCLLAARLAGRRLPARTAGIDIAQALLAAADAHALRVFLYGGKEGVAERAAQKLGERYPHLAFATADGYGDDPICEISRFSPHLVFVCLGAERQERWILSHKAALSAVCLGLGGSLDVWSGDVRRAPLFLQRLGLEWAWRTLKEPRRALRLLPLPAYFAKCLLSRLGQNDKKEGIKE